MNEQFKVTSAEKEPESLSSIDEYKEIEEKLDNPDPKQSFYEAEKISELKEKQDILKEEIIEDHLSEQSEEYRDLKKKLDDGDYIKDSSDSYTKDQTRLSELRKSLYEKSLKDSNPEYKKHEPKKTQGWMQTY